MANTPKPPAERQKNLRERKRAGGLSRKEYWATDVEHVILEGALREVRKVGVSMSKSTYLTEANAAKMGKAARQERYAGTHKLPSGRFCYVFSGV